MLGEGAVSHVVPRPFMRRMLAVQLEMSAEEPMARVECNAARTEVSWSRSIRRSTNSSNSSKSVVSGDVSEENRDVVTNSVRNQFSDIFEVSKCHCELLDHEFLNDIEECNVAGRLSRPESVKFFESIGAPEFVLNVVRFGHHSTFKSPVPHLERKNNGSFYKHKAWAVDEVKKFIQLDKVEIVESKPHCVLPLHVVVQPKKNRLVLDCGLLNDYIVIPKFKLDDYKVALNYFREKGWIFVFDFKDGYHHVKIHPDFRKFLGFTLMLDGKQVYCQFKVGLLGLADMPWLFTKIFRVLVKHWRSVAIPICLYLDDGWVFCRDFNQAMLYSRHIRSDLLKAGVVWSIKKSTWVPSTELEWLGMLWNSEDLTLKIVDRRILKLKSSASSILLREICTVRQLASLVGQFISLGPVVGNVSRLRSRFCQMVIAQAASYEDSVVLSTEVEGEVRFWMHNGEKLNCRNCVMSDPPLSVIVMGDASASGCGSFIQGTDLVAARLFSESERLAHSTWRELENIHFSLKAFKEQLRGRFVTFFVDNEASVSIVSSGSMKQDCHALALEIAEFCARYGIFLKVNWIPRTENTEADLWSRVPLDLDTDDWSITDAFFSVLCNRWGLFSVDCFANFYNHKVDRFYSLFYTPGSAGVDAFSFDWVRDFCLLVPPVALAGRVLEHLFRCKAKGVLVVPFWKSAFYWPLLIGFFKQFIKDSLVVKATKVLTHGRNVNSLLGSSSFSSYMIALLIDCSFSGD